MQSMEIRLAEMFKRVFESLSEGILLRVGDCPLLRASEENTVEDSILFRSDQVPLYTNFKNIDQTHRRGSTATEPEIQR